MMKRVFDDRMDLVLQLSLEMVRSRRATLGDSLDVDVDRFFSAALRDDPESIRRLLLKAELLDAQGKYDASIVAYEKVLRRTDVPEGLRAAAENNLGFLLALKGERLDEALSLVNSAIGIFGPVEDMLDTRAVVLMARGDNQQAIDEMTLATTTSQDPIKYYHLAKAYLANENFAKAKAAWERAEKLGFDPEKLPVLEQTDFSEVKQRIETGGNG
jgi:tetratricopeptide (TPR) repeat protein